MKTIAERVKAVRARARVRRWEYRQRNLAHGAWDRFRAALAHAREAYAIDDATAAELLAEGCPADDRGQRSGWTPSSSRHAAWRWCRSRSSSFSVTSANGAPPRTSSARSRLPVPKRVLHHGGDMGMFAVGPLTTE